MTGIDAVSNCTARNIALVSFVSFVTIVSKSTLIRPQPNFLSEGVRFGSDTKNGGWDILSVFPIRHFD